MTDVLNPLEELKALQAKVASVQMSTLDKNKEPRISYTPFATFRDEFYIYISALSPHTQHLEMHPRMDIMFIEDEAGAKNIFARKRASFRCHVEKISRDDEKWNDVMDAFEQQRGNTVSLIRQLTDFQLFKLNPTEGSLILGFGKAFQITGEKLDQLTQLSS